jgi:23S rRNA pseudouridine2605 synthase
MPALKTLERVLSKAGLGSRSDARRWIAEGRAAVNGKVEPNPDRWVDFTRDQVTFDGRPVRPGRKLYVLLYKPTGYLTTFKDPEGRPTVYDLLKDLGEWVVPVGRLDLETSGLLLLTNDTQFAERLTNPEYKFPKTYLVKAAGLLDDAQLERLRSGVELKDGPTRPAEVRRVRDAGKHTFLEIAITEGRNRQVRRMVEALESKVLKLVRTRIGPLEIGELRIGAWRKLTAEEARALGADPPDAPPQTHRGKRPPDPRSDRANQAQGKRHHRPNQRKHSAHRDSDQPERQK